MTPQYWYYGVFGKMGPYATSEEAVAKAQWEFDTIRAVGNTELAVASALLFSGVMYMTCRHPEEMKGVLQALTSLVTAGAKGTGEIIKGIGEVIPG